MNHLDAARAYIEAFTRGVPPNLYSYIWRKPPDGQNGSKATRSYAGGTPVTDMAAYALDSMHSFDVYMGMGLSSAPLTRYQRLKEGQRDAAGITGLWCDLDFGTEGHKNGNLPADEDEALEMLADVLADFPPTMAVNSGGGFHLYWLFNRPLIAGEYGVELPYIRDFVRRWNNMLGDHARKAGYDLDPLYDLERVLRIPGTLNHKPGYDQPREVKLALYTPDVRYDSRQLWEACEGYAIGPAPRGGETSNRATVTPAEVSGDLIVDARRQPPLAKLEALQANMRGFNGLWKKNDRRIEESRDSSASTYEFNMMLAFVRHGWTDQEMIDAVTYWRAKYGMEPVEKDLHYFQQSIGKARGVVSDGAPPNNNPPPPNTGNGDEGEDSGDPIDERAAAAEALSRELGLTRRGVRLIRILRIDGKEPTFRMETSAGWIEMGGAGNLADYPSCVRRMFGAGYNVIAPRDTWIAVKDRMIAVTDVESIPEVSASGMIMGLLDEYLTNRPILSNAEEADESRDPFTHDGARHFYLRSFVNWLGTNAQNERLSSQDAANALKAAGVQNVTVSLRNPKDLTKQTTRSVWKVPQIPLRLVPMTSGTEDDDKTESETSAS